MCAVNTHQGTGWKVWVLHAPIQCSTRMIINAPHHPPLLKQTCYDDSHSDFWPPESQRPKPHIRKEVFQVPQISAHNGDRSLLIDSHTFPPVPCQIIAQSNKEGVHTRTHLTSPTMGRGPCLLLCVEQTPIIYGPFRCKCIAQLAYTLHMQTIEPNNGSIRTSPQNLQISTVPLQRGFGFSLNWSNLTSNFYLMFRLASSLFTICRWEILFSASDEVTQKATDAG